jgi:hypothetical protein
VVVADQEANGETELSAATARERALWEKEVLGFQFGEHPFMEASAWLSGSLTHDTAQVSGDLSGEKVKIGGLVTGVRRILTRTKSQMAVVTLEDLSGTVEAVVFPRVYERSAEVFKEDAILVVEGRVDTRGERPQIVVDRAEVWTPPAAGTPPPARPLPVRVEPVRQEAPPVAAPGEAHANGHGAVAPAPLAGANGHHVLRVVVPRTEDDNACVRLLEQLHVLVERFPGGDEIQLVLHDRTGCKIELAGADIAVKHSSELESQVRTLVGEDNLQVARH